MARRAARSKGFKVGDHVTLSAEVTLVADHLGLTAVRIPGYGYPVTLKFEGGHTEHDKVTLEGHVTRVAAEGGRAFVKVQISGADYPVTLDGDRLTKV
jgi:hypothetical protein